jgi:hypothetical protein
VYAIAMVRIDIQVSHPRQPSTQPRKIASTGSIKQQPDGPISLTAVSVAAYARHRPTFRRQCGASNELPALAIERRKFPE